MHNEVLTHPADYSAPQKLGSEMRKDGVELFEYQSARDEGGVNVALFTPDGFAETSPSFQRQAICVTGEDKVSISEGKGELYQFNLDHFLIDGELPTPA